MGLKNPGSDIGHIECTINRYKNGNYGGHYWDEKVEVRVETLSSCTQ